MAQKFLNSNSIGQEEATVIIHRRMQWFLWVAVLAAAASMFVAGHRWSRPLASLADPLETAGTAWRILVAAMAAWHLTRTRGPATVWLSAALIAQGAGALLKGVIDMTAPSPGEPMSDLWYHWQLVVGGVNTLLRAGFWWSFWFSLRAWLAPDLRTGLRPVTWALAASTLTGLLFLLLIIPGVNLGAAGLAVSQLTMLGAAVFEAAFWLTAARLVHQALDHQPEAAWLAGGCLLLGAAWLGGGPTIMFSLWGPFLWYALSALGLASLLAWLFRGLRT